MAFPIDLQEGKVTQPIYVTQCISANALNRAGGGNLIQETQVCSTFQVIVNLLNY